MDIKEIRKLLRPGGEVVILEDGRAPLVVRELSSEKGGVVDQPAEEVVISKPAVAVAPRQDLVLERLNKEILALKAQIAEEEGIVQE